jgi:hypothetical protein
MVPRPALPATPGTPQRRRSTPLWCPRRLSRQPPAGAPGNPQRAPSGPAAGPAGGRCGAERAEWPEPVRAGAAAGWGVELAGRAGGVCLAWLGLLAGGGGVNCMRNGIGIVVDCRGGRARVIIPGLVRSGRMAGRPRWN